MRSGSGGMRNVMTEECLCPVLFQYDEDVDYEAEPDPPLDAADARWAGTLLRQTGRRGGG